MMRSQPIITGFDASAEALDGLALAGLLAGLLGGELVVARVFEGEIEHEEPDRDWQRGLRASMSDTRRAVLAAVPGTDADLMPLVDMRASHALHELAEARDAALLVLGSSHHGHLGRMLLGSTAEAVINGAPCPVAVAPPGFAAVPTISPLAVGIGYDGAAEARAALPMAIALADAARARLQIIAVEPPWWEHPLAATPIDAPSEARAALAGVPAEIPVDLRVLHGDPAEVLVDAGGREVGLMVAGSQGKGPLRRALLGSVSTALVRHSSCPVVVVPRGH